MARFDLNGAAAIVTGASRGIGPHIAAALAQRQAHVALVARSEAELDATTRKLSEAGHRVVAIPGDVTSAEGRHAIVETARRELGSIDVLVNNAGGEPQREFHQLTEHEIEGILDLNLTSAVVLSRLVLPGMLARERGHIVNVSGPAGNSLSPPRKRSLTEHVILASTFKPFSAGPAPSAYTGADAASS
jgi:short-subunit dehydrogenase